MNFLIFIIYYFICTFIVVLIGFSLYKFKYKHKYNKICKEAENNLEKFFNAYDDDFDSLINVVGDKNDDNTNR